MSPHVAATTPYPWPFDADLAGAATALVVVVPAARPRPSADVVASVRALAAAVRSVGGVVIAATTTAPARLLPTPNAAPGTETQATVLLGLLGPIAPDHTVAAGGVDAFYASDLDLLLRTRGVARLVIAGVGLETSAHSTMRDANDRGYECLLVVDACEPVDPALVGPAVSMVEMSGGIFGAVGRTADVVAALGTTPTPAVRDPFPGPDRHPDQIPAQIPDQTEGVLR